MDQYCCAVGSERSVEGVDVLEEEVGGPDGVIDVWVWNDRVLLRTTHAC